jgi:hypothetical protein
MLGIAAALKRLNRWHVNCGATYQWGAGATNSSVYFTTRREAFTPGALPAQAGAGQLQPPAG